MTGKLYKGEEYRRLVARENKDKHRRKENSWDKEKPRFEGSNQRSKTSGPVLHSYTPEESERKLGRRLVFFA